MDKNKNVELFNKVLKIALQVPYVKIDRKDFLRDAFSNYCTEEQLAQIIEKNPRAILELRLLDVVANNVIKVAQKEVTLISSVSGLPGNPLAATGLAIVDMGQYVGFCLNISQKLAYIYGYPDLINDGKLTQNSVNILTPMLGVMFGIAQASKLMPHISKALAIQVAKRLPTIAFGHAAWYIFVKQVAKWIGIRMSKPLFAKTASHMIPIVGSILSGTITYVAFGPSANKLAKQLRSDSEFFKDVEHTAEEIVEDVEFQELNS